MADYTKPDYWQLLAQKEGYPARSVYKLKEIDEKFNVLKQAAQGKQNRSSDKPGFRILDIGAAPGSWSLYVLRKLNGAGLLVSADLSPLSRQYDKGLFDGENFFFVQGDITNSAIRQTILSYGPYNLILSDAAPATTGNRWIDTARSMDLAQAVLEYAQVALDKGGNMVIKVFQGEDTVTILKQIKELFNTGKSFKPETCRSESFETYYLGLGKKLTPR